MTSKTKRILVVVESLEVDSGSGAKANMALIRNLIEAGFCLKIYHYTRKEVVVEGAEVVSIPERRRNLLFFLSRCERQLRKFFRIRLNPFIEKQTGFSFTLFNDRNSIQRALQTERPSKYDWLLTLSQGGSFRPHHALLKMADWHYKWIAYIHDPYPMHWYPKPYTWKESGYKQKQEFMEAVADSCRYTAFPSLLLKKWMGSHYKEFTKKGILIPHQLTPGFPAKQPKEINIVRDEFTVLHSGNLLQARRPNGLIEGFKKFVQKNPLSKCRFIHVGPAPHYEAYLIKEATESDRIEVYCGSYPFQEVKWLQQNADVNVIIEAKGDMSPFLPGKFPHCIATGKPILLLGPANSESRRLLGKDYPYWAQIDDENEISDLLGELYENWMYDRKVIEYSEIQEYLAPGYLKQLFLRL